MQNKSATYRILTTLSLIILFICVFLIQRYSDNISDKIFNETLEMLESGKPDKEYALKLDDINKYNNKISYLTYFMWLAILLFLLGNNFNYRKDYLSNKKIKK